MCWLEVYAPWFFKDESAGRRFLIQLHDNSCFACHMKNKSSLCYMGVV